MPGKRSPTRENNPLDPIVVTMGSIHGGTKHNIIPDEVKMQLTVRTYKKEVREKVLAAIERIAKGWQPPPGFRLTCAPIVSVQRFRPCDVQQSRTNETAGRCLEKNVRRRQCGDGRSNDGR